MKLWLVRHAQPLIAPGLCYGRLDVPADAALSAQAAQSLHAALVDAPPAALRTSPLSRARALAQALAERLALPLQEDERLAEMDFGQWEGVAWDRIPKAAVDAWTADFAHHRFGGGESTQQVLQRVWAAVQEARLASVDQLWVTHAGVIRAVQHLLARHGPHIAHAQEWPRCAPGWGQWQVFDF